MIGEGDAAAVVPATDSQLPILVVDDRQENLRALQAVLEPLAVSVQTASSGEEALRMLLRHDFSLILLDVRMPGLDGIQTARLIKERERTRDIPIVFLTAARDEVGDMIRGYGVGAIDYVLKPFDAELLRSKVLVFAELEHSRRALKQSEAFLRGAFDAAPIGKSVLDEQRRIVRANPAFARIIGQDPEELHGVAIADLCHPDDRAALSELLDNADTEPAREVGDSADLRRDLRLQSRQGRDAWVAPAASLIENTGLGSQLLLVQWVDISVRRRAEQARAELLLEQAARIQAEAATERLQRLQHLVDAVEARPLSDSVPELARRLAAVFGADAAEVEIEAPDGPIIARACGGHVEVVAAGQVDDGHAWSQDARVSIDGATLGCLRLLLGPERRLSTDKTLLDEVAERIALTIRRAQLHDHEHWIAVELQRGLLPERLPDNPRIAIAAHYQAAGVGAEVGGDWYDVFPLPGQQLGVVVGDVTGSGIRAASAMGQLRSATRAFALGDEQPGSPAEVLTRLSRYLHLLAFADVFTLLYAVVDPVESVVRWASAGHPPPLLRQGIGTRALHGTAGVVGLDNVVYEDHHTSVEGGAHLVLYTDGLIERRGETIDAGVRRLQEAIAHGPDDPHQLCGHILSSTAIEHGQQEDDVTVVVLKISEDEDRG
jgi:PAS domain S-box-containing protein